MQLMYQGCIMEDEPWWCHDTMMSLGDIIREYYKKGAPDHCLP